MSYDSTLFCIGEYFSDRCWCFERELLEDVVGDVLAVSWSCGLFCLEKNEECKESLEDVRVLLDSMLVTGRGLWRRYLV